MSCEAPTEAQRAACGISASAADLALFARSMLVDPRRVAALAPSGRVLALLISREIDNDSGPVLELGPGTGAFTRALLDKGVRPHNLTLIEAGAEFVACLQQRFPDVRVVHMDAARLGPSRLFERESLGAVVSGLPVLSMRRRSVLRLLAAAFAALRPGSALYQFTYGPVCPVPLPLLDRLGLRAERTGTTWRNVPPASVYRISRRAAQSTRHSSS
jgi:phosphatidylethanolamine/phosphatidyl-N-methylethanolamine N-methyltransferase